MKAHRQYVEEQIKHDKRFAKDLYEARIQVRLAVMITKLREERGWSQRDLAKITGIKQPQIARIEKGEHLPTLETLWKLADAFDAKIVIGPHQKLEIRAA
ncbi:MAG: helix-turn-helix transcriptional regulator [Thermodesulfobacteriota bacterium]|nr:helix-turn-helix transcriptional regulator [Thermodesulfobacteriota bacterium]